MPSEEKIFELVRGIIKEVLPDIDHDQILPNKSLMELGANSIDRVEVVTMSMEQLDVIIPLLNFAHINNIGELVGVLCMELTSSTSQER